MKFSIVVDNNIHNLRLITPSAPAALAFLEKFSNAESTIKLGILEEDPEEIYKLLLRLQ